MLHLCRQVSVKMFGDIVWRRVTVGRIVSMSFACNKTLARRSLKPWMLFDGLLITNINIVLQQVSLRRNISINKIWLESINSAKSEQCSSGRWDKRLGRFFKISEFNSFPLVTHFSTGQLLCDIPYHQANRWWYSFNTGQWPRSHRGLICLWTGLHSNWTRSLSQHVCNMWVWQRRVLRLRSGVATR